VLSSFDTADFSFFGFLPTKDGQIKKFLTPLKERQETLIFYESPKRIRHTLELVSEVFGPEREVAIIRELTKIHEETIASKVSEILSSSFEEKGEFVLIIKGSEERTIDQKEIDNRIKEGLKAGKSSSSLAKEIAAELSLSKNQIYDRILTLSKKLRG
ncbi:MAG: SAM-dependent methyltransferase, partial [Candidatus Enterosoma sp.]